MDSNVQPKLRKLAGCSGSQSEVPGPAALITWELVRNANCQASLRPPGSDTREGRLTSNLCSNTKASGIAVLTQV